MRAVVFAVLFAVAGLARADPSLASATAGWTAAQRTAAEASVGGLVAAGLTREAALDHVHEWQAKGADAVKLLALLEGLRLAAVDGREVLRAAGVQASSPLVEAAAAARLAGVSKDDLGRALRGASTTEEAQARCLTVSTFALSGFAPHAAADVVTLAAERGYRRADLGAMVGAVQRLAREGVAPRDALLGELGAALRRGTRPGELYPAVLQAFGPGRLGPEGGFNHGGPHGGH